MRNLKYSLVSLVALSSVLCGGPLMKSKTDYDAEDMKKAQAVIKEPSAKQKESLLKPVDTETKEKSTNIPSVTKDMTQTKKPTGHKKVFDFGKKRTLDESGGFWKNALSEGLKKGFKRNNFYIGLGLCALGIDSEDTATIFANRDTQDRQIGFMLKFGYNIFEHLFAEVRGTYGIVNEADETKFKNVAFYLRPNYNLNEDLQFYGLLGYGSSNLQGDQVNGAGFSYGLGAKYYTFSNSGIYVDLVNYLAKSDSNSMWGLNIGIEAEF